MAKKVKQIKPKVPIRISFAKNELRKSFKRWFAKNECKKLARVERGKYQCANCKELFKEPQMEVDHRESVVPIDIPGSEQSLENYVDRLFVEVDKLDLLCKPCHKQKSKNEQGLRKIARDKRKEIKENE